ncbi:MAG TPA: DUF4245 domain-containing protein [Jatrophihabitans sp.]|nr:DUF4245 domain-containing protein [Jatrophihabitans sp.]
MTRPLTSSERQRLRTSGNLWRALIPILLVIGALVAWERVNEPHSDGIHVVDTTAAVAAARQQAGFGLVLPAGLPDGWRPTSTQFEPAGAGSAASFRIGYVTPEQKYAEFYESDDAPDAVAAQLGVLTGAGTVAGWAEYRTSDGRTALRRTFGAVTVLVSGNAGQDELTTLATAMRPS